MGDFIEKTVILIPICLLLVLPLSSNSVVFEAIGVESF